MTATSGEALIEVSRCSKRYPGVKALHDVSITVGPREVRGLVGQNGAGKSTLIKVMAGALRPDSGDVRAGREARPQSFDVSQTSVPCDNSHSRSAFSRSTA